MNSLYFVYLAKKMPDYGLDALRLAQQMYGGSIHLIGNHTMKRIAVKAKVDFTSIETFYEGKKFKTASKNLTSDYRFRNGFWFKSMERLFVLEEFMEYGNLESLMHAELDQLLFGTSELLERLEKISCEGIYLPFHSKNAVVASTIFINGINSLRSLTNFASGGETFTNEMNLLARWAAANPNLCLALPTLATELKSPEKIVPKGIRVLKVEEVGGLVDPAQLGQWIGGIDPRNVPLSTRPSTRFIDKPESFLLSQSDLESFELSFDSTQKHLNVKYTDKQYKIYNLHLHSKCHNSLFYGRPSLQELIKKCNERTAVYIPELRRDQYKFFFEKALMVLMHDPKRIVRELKWRIKFLLGLRPSSSPFISGDTFRAEADYIWESKSKEISPKDILPGDIIFCESELIGELIESVLSKIQVPVVLILGNSDKNHSQENWDLDTVNIDGYSFVQNLEQAIERVDILPIGIENSWRSNHGNLKLDKVIWSANTKRLPRIMWGFSISTNPPQRTVARDNLKSCETAEEITQATAKEHQNLLCKYSFVASPPGNGLDTHRTWEAMYFHCVPIVLRSYMTSQYESMGLPIWVVDSYKELQKYDEKSLKAKYEEFLPKFKNDAIWARYWLEKIRNKSEELEIKYRHDTGL